MKDDLTPTEGIDSLIQSIKADTPSETDILAASERVRAAIADLKVPQKLSAAAPQTNEVEQGWNSVEDYIAAIPDYLAGQLTAAQSTLFEEESRRSIPLRRALVDAKGAGETEQLDANQGQSTKKYGWLAAAAAVATVAIALFTAVPELPSFDQTRVAQISDVEGQLYQLVDGQLESLTAGTWIDGRQRIRSANGSTAMITLDDGSEIEVDERSEISMTRRGSGNRIDVSRGRILVVASPQGSGTLDVFTDEFMVSVTGTIFEVAHGAKGSLVSVVEGEVNVLLQGNTTSLTPGDALASRMDRLALSVEDEISWSADADLYIDMLNEVAALQQDLEAALATPSRYSTRLLDLAPADTSVYIAVPNAPEKIAEVYDVIRSRMQGSQFLADAWTDFESASEGQHLDETMSWMREIGYSLGEETVFTLSMQPGSTQDEEGFVAIPVILSEVDGEAFTANFEQQMQKLQDVLETQGEDSDLEIALINDPTQAVDGQLSLWIYEGILVASIDAAALQEMQSAIDQQSSAFVGTKMHEILRTSYDQGTQILGAVDIANLIAPIDTPSTEMEKAGLANAEYLVAQHQQNNGGSTITADLYFDGETQGLMSVLATPGPMGSLEFFSVDSTMAAAMLLREPISILEEFGPIELPDGVDAAQELELLYSVLGVLGGEMAIGLDGPALPTPAWKAVIESYDANILQDSIEWSIARFNEVSVQANEGSEISISSSDIGNYIGYEISMTSKPTSPGLLDNLSFNYAYVDGYLVAAANQVLVSRAIDYYESGSGLQTDSEFRELLARDGYLDFSAIYFSRLGELMDNVLQNLPSDLTEEQQAGLAALDTEIGPSITSVLALPDKIHFAHRGSSQLPVQIFSQLMSLRPIMESAIEQAQVQ